MKKKREFWVDMNTQNHVLRWTAGGLFLVVSILVALLALIVTEPPFVIRVAANGETRVIEGASPAARPSLEEVKVFGRAFLTLYLAPSQDQPTKDLARAMAVMEPALRTAFAKEIQNRKYLKDLEKSPQERSVYFGEVLTRQASPGYSFHSVGVVESRSGKDPEPHRRGFGASLTLRETARSEWNPQGLMVVDATIEFESSRQTRSGATY